MSRKKSFKLDNIEIFDVSVNTDEKDIIWTKCFICQKDTAEKTSCPANVVKILDNIRRFDLLIDLSTSLKERLAFPSIEKKCCEEKAVFHKTCKNKFDDYHFGRVSGKKKKNNDGDDDKASPNLIKTRSNFTATNFQKSCFFCESSSHEPLHVIQTFKVDQT